MGGVTIRIGAQRDVHPLRCIAQIEMGRFAEATGAERAVPSLISAATSHIEFIHDQMALHVGHANVQRKERTS